jgi:hypothetical protein
MENCRTGCGKKKQAVECFSNDPIIDNSLPTRQKLQMLLQHIRKTKNNKYIVNEVLMRIRPENVNFIYYSHDITLNDALYMQKAVKSMLGKDIPIFKYCNKTQKFIDNPCT